jgi:hypothetical protein
LAAHEHERPSNSDFYPLHVVRERNGEVWSTGGHEIQHGRIIASLAILIDTLESRGVLSAEDVNRILSE